MNFHPRNEILSPSQLRPPLYARRNFTESRRSSLNRVRPRSPFYRRAWIYKCTKDVLVFLFTHKVSWKVFLSEAYLKHDDDIFDFDQRVLLYYPNVCVTIWKFSNS